jgi:CRP/FNR family transcriptional regulator, cyclic AMP receptor protein
MWLLIAGWISAALVFSTFFMKTMIPLRLIGIASNVAFMSYALLGLQYGVFGQLYPILVLHAGLLPLNGGWSTRSALQATTKQSAL